MVQKKLKIDLIVLILNNIKLYTNLSVIIIYTFLAYEYSCASN